MIKYCHYGTKEFKTVGEVNTDIIRESPLKSILLIITQTYISFSTFFKILPKQLRMYQSI